MTYEKICFPLYDRHGVQTFAATTIDQRRFCLTAIEEHEVYDHSAVFGAFSFAFDTEVIRRCGGFPVIYVPSPLTVPGGVSSASTVGSNFIHQLRDVIVLLQELIHLNDIVIINKGELDETLSVQTRRRSGPIKLREIDIILDFLLGEKGSFEDMLDSLQFASNFFYHADSARPHKTLDAYDLAYYRQREWRLVSGLLSDPETLEEAISAPYREMLERVHPFFAKQFEDNDGMLLRQSEIATRIPVMCGLPFSESLKAAYIPDVCFDELADEFVSMGGNAKKLRKIDYSQLVQRRAMLQRRTCRQNSGISVS
ncbi:hypothetical protein [Mesorhizobium sp. KR2-14]|uniref:hypothetical protein n=1 Tax=Mesorhizobium sp. KR2-14 TaxID=3156610 RepID=UPI0032B37EAC